MIARKVIIIDKDNSTESLGPGWLQVQPLTKRIDDASLSEGGVLAAGYSGTLQNKLVELVNEAEEVVCISTFLIEDTEFLQAVNAASARGVRIYLATSVESQLGKEEDELHDMNERRRIYFEMLKRLEEFALIRTGEHLHAKFIVTDPKTNPKGYVLTCNLTKKGMGEDLDVAVELTPNQARAVFAQFKAGFLGLAKREDVGGTLIEIEKVNVDYQESGEILATIGNITGILEKAKELISGAKKTIRLSAWTIEADLDVSRMLLEKANQGVSIEAFTRPAATNYPFLRDLPENASVFCHNLLHAKCIIVDDTRGLMMTANISKRGILEGFETAVVLQDIQISKILQIMEAWKKCATHIFRKNILAGNVETRAIVVQAGKTIEVPKQEQELRELDIPVMCNNIDDFINGRYSVPKPDIKFRYEKFKLILTPPLLPSHVNEKNHRIEKIDGISVYASSKNEPTYIAIQDLSQMNVARDMLSKRGGRIVVDPQSIDNVKITK